MEVYLLLIGVVLILMAVFTYTLINVSHKIISKFVKNKVLSWVLALIPLLLFALGLFIDTINAIIVDLHLMIIVLLSKLLFFVIQKISKKKFNESLSVAVGVIITIVVMCFGYHQAYDVKETYYTVNTKKDIESDDFRIVQICDSHIGTTLHGKDFKKYVDKINALNPDIVVITGDFVDDNSTYEDMKDAGFELGKLITKYGVYFVYGNHDKGYYNKRDFSDKELRDELIKNNITIMEDECIDLTNNMVLVGRQDREVSNRKSIHSLVKNISEDKYMIVLDHQPNDYDNEKDANVDLVLSGHTHGGQLFPLGQIGVLLGANDMFYGLKKIDNTTFIVNSGISDWALKFKIGAISEYVIVDVTYD